MIKYCCDICGKEVTDDDNYIDINDVLICGVECGIEWIKFEFAQEGE